jgi:hypothetical protein
MKRLTIRGTGLALGIFFDVTFMLCVLWGMLLPALHARGVPILEGILPGFTWLTPGSVILGLVEAFFYGMYIALVFVPLFNYFEGGRSGERATPAPSRETFGREAVTRG